MSLSQFYKFDFDMKKRKLSPKLSFQYSVLMRYLSSGCVTVDVDLMNALYS